MADAHPELTPVVVCASGGWAGTANDAEHAEELRLMFDERSVPAVHHCMPHRVEWWAGSRVRRAQRKAGGS